MTTIGVISDTHGLVRPEALAALAGVARILHAGDVGGPEVLAALAAIAPVTAVRGNNDAGGWARALPLATTVEIEGHAIHLLHDRKALAGDPRRFAAVITGHSHKPLVEEQGGVLFLNPRSAGPRRFKLPIALARLHVGRTLRAELVTL